MPPPPEGELVSQFYISLSSLCDTGHPSPPAEKKEPRKAAHLTGVYVEVQVGLGEACGRTWRGCWASVTVLWGGQQEESHLVRSHSHTYRAPRLGRAQF